MAAKRHHLPDLFEDHAPDPVEAATGGRRPGAGSEPERKPGFYLSDELLGRFNTRSTSSSSRGPRWSTSRRCSRPRWPSRSKTSNAARTAPSSSASGAAAARAERDATMSRAFVKEPDGYEVPPDPPNACTAPTPTT